MQKWLCDILITSTDTSLSIQYMYCNNLSVLLTLIVFDLNHNVLSMWYSYHVKISGIKLMYLNKFLVYFAIHYSMKQITIIFSLITTCTTQPVDIVRNNDR